MDAIWPRTFVIVVLVVALCWVGAVIKLYGVAYRKMPRRLGLTPKHVVLVSAGVLLWGAALAWALLMQLGSTLTWDALTRLGMYAVGAGFIIAALWIVGGMQRRRLSFTKNGKGIEVSQTGETRAVTPKSTGEPPR